MPRPLALAAALLAPLLLAGCVGDADASAAERSRPIDAITGEIEILDATESVRYDPLEQTVAASLDGRAEARDARDALLGVYLAKGRCPARTTPSGEAPSSPLASDSFAFPSARSELRVHATLSGGPVLPGEEFRVVWLADASNGAFGAYRCAAYRALPLSEGGGVASIANAAPSTRAAASAVSFQPDTIASATIPSATTGATSATPTPATIK